jgi:putative endonuclease
MYLPYSTYVLRSLKDGENYIGFSTDIEKRIKAHNLGNNKSTKNRRPFKLIYCEFHISKKDALRREKYFKSSKGRRVLKLMLRDYYKTNP